MKSLVKFPIRKSGIIITCMALSFSCTNLAPGERSNSLLSTSNEKTIEPGMPVAATTTTTVSKSGKKIKIALLLDTSNSMDGLIEQAKSQLWKLVNELSLATCDNLKPELEIALYEYGNLNLAASDGYIRQVTPFTTDLDAISEKLFSLSTNGGDEYCGQVIQASANELNWEADTTDYKVIFIAGNEEFTQGTVNYKKSCALAKDKDIYVNTIFCGEFTEGMNTGWKNGSTLASGAYMNINPDEKTVYIETPFDKEITDLNASLNDTYIGYGKYGTSKKQNQVMQDANASNYSMANTTERTVTKASAFYKNDDWDLVDASKKKDFNILTIKDSDLPKELKGKTGAEKQQYIDSKKKEREAIIQKIAELNKKRLEYIAEKQKTMKGNDKSLDAAMIKAIRAQAGKKNFVFS